MKAPEIKEEVMIQDLKENFGKEDNDVEIELEDFNELNGLTSIKTKKVEILLKKFRLPSPKRKLESESSEDFCNVAKKFRSETKDMDFFPEVINCEWLNSNSEEQAFACHICKRIFIRNQL